MTKAPFTSGRSRNTCINLHFYPCFCKCAKDTLKRMLFFLNIFSKVNSSHAFCGTVSSWKTHKNVFCKVYLVSLVHFWSRGKPIQIDSAAPKMSFKNVLKTRSGSIAQVWTGSKKESSFCLFGRLKTVPLKCICSYLIKEKKCPININYSRSKKRRIDKMRMNKY